MYCHTKQKMLRKKFCMTKEKTLTDFKKLISEFCMTKEKNLDKKNFVDLKVLYDKRKKIKKVVDIFIHL